MKTVVNGVSLFVEDRGQQGPVLVFLHYWGGTHRTWNEVIAELGGLHRTVAYDMRGWGQSDPAGGYSIKELAQDGLELLKLLRLQEFVLVGHSMGGKVAQLMASQRPAGLKGLVLVAPAMPVPTHFPPLVLEQQLHAYESREGVLQAIQFLCARRPADTIVDRIVEDSMSGTLQARRAWPLTASVEDISGEVGRIDVPTLVLAGDEDRLDSIEQHEREVLPRIPGATLKVLTDCGHLSPADQPVALACAIREFVDRLHSASA